MLKLKLKEVLLAQGTKKPQAWLQKHCNLSFAKSHNLINNKQKSIAYEDLSKICSVLECTPDELFWWDNTTKHKVTEWHPCMVKLTKPSKDADWTKRIETLDMERVEKLKKFMETLETDKRNEARKIYDGALEKEKEQKDNEQNEIDTAPPLD